MGRPRLRQLLGGELHAAPGEVPADGVAERHRRVSEARAVERPAEGSGDDLGPLSEDGCGEALHPGLVDAGGRRDVGHGAPLAEAGLDLPDRETALGPGAGGRGPLVLRLAVALERLADGVSERVVDGEQVAARARAAADAQDECVSRCGDADEMKLLHA